MVPKVAERPCEPRIPRWTILSQTCLGAEPAQCSVMCGATQPHQHRQGRGADLSHHAVSVVLHRALADSQVGSNVLGRLSHDHAIHHLPFTLGQGREAGGHFIALGAIVSRLLAVGQNPVDALAQRLGAHRLLQEVGCALSHRLHRRERGRHSRSGR